MQHLKLLGAAAAAVVLAACGGGGTSTPTPTPVTTISQSESTAALGITKYNNTLLALDVIARLNSADTLRVLTSAGGQTGASGSSTTTAACSVSGSLALSYRKSSSGTGLTAGDYYTITFNNCTNTGKPKQNGTMTVYALTTTSIDISASTVTSFALPLSIVLTNFTESDSTIKNSYNGTINFSAFSLGQSGSGSLSLITTPNISVVRTLATGNTTPSTYNYSNSTFNLTLSSAGAASYQMNYDASITTPPALPIQMTVVSSSTGSLAAPTSFSVVITKYLGGKVTGNMPIGSNNISVSVDYGNDGSVDNTYTIAYTAL